MGNEQSMPFLPDAGCCGERHVHERMTNLRANRKSCEPPKQDFNPVERTCYETHSRKKSASRELDSGGAPPIVNDVYERGHHTQGSDLPKNIHRAMISKQEENFLRLIREKEQRAKTTVKGSSKEQADRWCASINQKLAEKQRKALLQSGKFMKCQR
jgi:hypothetical protein